MKLEEDDTAIPLDGFEVVAVPDKGVYITDTNGLYWYVGGPRVVADSPNKLGEAYQEAVRND